MTPEQLDGLTPHLDNYLQQFELCCLCPQNFRLFGVYCRGLLTGLDRKSAEPIALFADVPARTLQQFLKDHHWSFPLARDVLQHDVLATLNALPAQPADDLGTIGLIDETSTVKKGTKTPGVQRQWCGAVGKMENCIVTVHLGVARGRYKTLIDAELFLPKESWHDDRERCRAADIPDSLVYQPKWQIALRQILRSQAVGFDLNWLTFDEGYGSKPGFLDGLEEMGLSYVGEVPCSFSCFTRPPADGVSGHRADDLVRHSPVFYQQQWQEVTLTRQTLGEQVWAAKMAPVYVRQADTGVAVRRWLMAAWNPATQEEKYFMCGGREADLPTRLRVGFTRHNVEHSFRLAKTELGFSHYEGRSYVGLMRHMMLCLVTQGFVAQEAASLRGEKSGGDGRAGVHGLAVAAPDGDVSGAGTATPDRLAGADAGLQATPQSSRTRIAPAAGSRLAARATSATQTQTTQTTVGHSVAL
jgi:SRSO17 transposase